MLIFSQSQYEQIRFLFTFQLFDIKIIFNIGLQTMGDKWIQVSFLKMEINPSFILETSKIMISILALHRIFAIKCPRPIRNGFVNFFGQLITLPYATKEFTIIVQSIDRFGRIKELSRIKIQNINKQSKKNVSLAQENQFLKLHSTLRVITNLDVSSCRSQQKTQQDLSEIDTQVHKYMRNIKKQSFAKQMFSPEKIKQKYELKCCDDSMVQFFKTKNIAENLTPESIRTKLFRQHSKSFLEQMPIATLKKQKFIDPVTPQSTKTIKQTKSENNFFTKKEFLQKKEDNCRMKRQDSLSTSTKSRIWEKCSIKGFLITGLTSFLVQAFILKIQHSSQN